MKKYFLLALLMVIMLLATACAPAAPQGVPQKEHDATLAELAATNQLLALYQATAKYTDVNVALADGYVPGGPCVSSPAGGMGIHYVNPKLVAVPVDALKPAILLYVPTDKGLKLLGVEYTTVALTTAAGGSPALWVGKDPPASWTTAGASVLGQKFNGPMAGHAPNDPWHYDLHAYLWEANPTGMFKDFNPNVKCPPAPPAK